MRNKTFLEDFEMAEIGKVSATLAKLLQLLVRSNILSAISFSINLGMSFIFTIMFLLTIFHLQKSEPINDVEERKIVNALQDFMEITTRDFMKDGQR